MSREVKNYVHFSVTQADSEPRLTLPSESQCSVPHTDSWDKNRNSNQASPTAVFIRNFFLVTLGTRKRFGQCGHLYACDNIYTLEKSCTVKIQRQRFMCVCLSVWPEYWFENQCEHMSSEGISVEQLLIIATHSQAIRKRKGRFPHLVSWVIKPKCRFLSQAPLSAMWWSITKNWENLHMV